MSNKIHNACIYARLSRDDGDKLESDSITNQKALIRDFLSKHPEIHVVSEKTDDGYSGVNFDRPAFQEMMDEIRSGKVNCVVVKDLSRFGRNYIEAGNYIERVFPFMGVRFIAINDSYDSLDKNQSDSLIIPFKNLINDAYCKDISVKIRSQLEIKRKKGQFIGAFAVYGYLKDEEDHNKLVVDTFASEVVRAIFKWKLEGMSQGRIADKLNMQGVLCPMEYKISLGMKVQTNFRVHKKAMWSPVSVTRILTNEIYTGVLVQGKSGTPNYKVKKVMPKDEEEWIRVEDSHPAIITKRNFDTVQRIMQRDIRIAPAEETVYPFSGYLKCADCGQNMVRKHYAAGDKEYTYFICSTRKAKKGCSTHSIDEETLTASVLNAIKNHIDMILEAEQLLELVESLPENQQNVFNYDAQIVKLKEEIERNKTFKLKLYENLQEGMIGQDEYFLFKKSYAMKIQEAEQAIAAIEAEREQMVNNNREQLSWTEVFKQYQNITEVTRNVVVDLIDHIEILEGKGIHVVFRYHDNWDKLIAAVSNMPSDMNLRWQCRRCGVARKSRKTTGAIIEAPVQTSSYFSTAVYVRLSIENSGKDDDGDSIANQISFCKAYLAEHTDLKLYGIYEDNGEKGTNFDRPEFKRMMDDIRSGKVKCVLVKDLSRFGRDYIEAGEYLEKIFPFMGIRFISITDGYDSLTCDDAEGALMIPLKNMINDVYAKDISRKIITSFRARQEKGEFLPAFAPYGYVKSKEVAYRYEVDQETAPYVRMIYEWKADGVSHSEICKRLNDMGAVTPARRKVDLGIWRAEKYKNTVWFGRTIIDILKNPTYTGCIVYGRIPKSLYEGIKMHRAPEEEWRYVPDAHEPIISQELFDKVQKMFADRAKTFKEKMDKNAPLRELVTNHFKGKIYCGDCGKRMRFVKPTDRRYPVDQDHAIYVCGGYLDSGYSRCSRHSIRYPVVAEAVLAAIKVQLDFALKQEQLIRQMRGSEREKKLIDKYVGQINYLSQELKKINGKRESLFENFAEGILDEAEYQFAKKKYDEEAANMEKKLIVEKAKKTQLDDVLSLSNEWLGAIHQAEDITEIDSELVKHLVSSVKVFEDNRVEVELNFAEQRNIFNLIIAEMAGDGRE